jgi:hypothetical protein
VATRLRPKLFIPGEPAPFGWCAVATVAAIPIGFNFLVADAPLACCGVWLIPGALFVTYLVRRGSLAARIDRTRHMVCLQCLYDLPDQDEGCCSECWSPISRANQVHEWSRWTHPLTPRR